MMNFSFWIKITNHTIQNKQSEMASSTTTGSETADPNDIDYEPAAAASTEYMTVREVLDKHSEQAVLHKINIYGVITYLPSGALRKGKKISISYFLIYEFLFKQK